MKTTLDLDQELVEEAMNLSGEKTMKSTVEAALKELVAKKRREGLMRLIGKMDLTLTPKSLAEMRKNQHDDVPD